MLRVKVGVEVCDSFGPRRSVSSLFADYGFTGVNQVTPYSSNPDRDEYLLSGRLLLDHIQHQAGGRGMKENLQLLQSIGMVCIFLV